VILGHSVGVRHSYPNGTFRVYSHVPGGLKLVAYGNNGITEIFVKTTVPDVVANLINDRFTRPSKPSRSLPMSSVASVVLDDSTRNYDGLVSDLQTRFLATLGSGRLFTTDASDLYETYLSSLPLEWRKYHTCHCCHRFIESYGHLVTIDDKGISRPAVWHEDAASDFYRPAVAALARLVRKAKVNGVFLSKLTTYGTPVTGLWTHFALTPPTESIHRSALLSAGQAMAEKREDYANVQRALSDFSSAHLDTAVRLLESESLYRTEKVLGPAKWLRDLQIARHAAHGPASSNLVWRAVATAPAGFCHPRSSMIGTLLEDLASGLDFANVARKFATKMNPLQYQRPTVAPSAGNIAQAEKMVETLGIARSLERRFARLDEVETLWTPPVKSPASPASSGGVFAHLAPRGHASTGRPLQTPPITMTWDKFARTVLGTASDIEFRVPSGPANYASLVTGVHADAPPIIQWDRDDRRNPVSWYLYHHGSMPANWGLVGGSFHKVSAVTFKPSMWGADPDACSHQGQGVIFLLDGSRDVQNTSLAIFPEILKAEFHAIRSTIEAFSRAGKLAGQEESSASGILLQKGTPWDAFFRVTTGATSQDYRLDRWD
jgi:hypothetical protein